MSKMLDEITTVMRREQRYRAAAEHLGFVAVCLVGYAQSVPRYFGDNEGAWPIRVITTKDPKNYPKKEDLGQPIHELKVLAYVWTESDAHAKRLKNRLEALMYGHEHAAERQALRHNWINVDDPVLAWEFLLKDAIIDIRQRERFVVFDEDEKKRRIEKEAAQGMKGRRQ